MPDKRPKKALGKGLDSLLSPTFNREDIADSKDRVQIVLISQIKPNPDQPRRHFAPEAIKELAASIKHYGILQPLIVTPHNDAYIIVAGERRYRAAMSAGLEKLPVIVRKEQELAQLEIALIENVQRVDLSPLEQAASIEKLHMQFSLSWQEIGERLGKASSTVSNTARLLQLPEAARQALAQEKITEGHARSILAIKDFPEEQAKLLKLIVTKSISVRQAEQFAIAVKSNAPDKPPAATRLATTTPGTEALATRLKTPVSIRRTAKGGRLEIHFTDDDQLEQLLNRL